MIRFSSVLRSGSRGQRTRLTGCGGREVDIEHGHRPEKGRGLHVVARVKKPKARRVPKRRRRPRRDGATRGKFLDDVVESVKAAYSIELAAGDA